MKARLLMTAVYALMLGSGSVAHAQATWRGWIPTADFDFDGIRRGDLFSFKCPKGGTFFAFVENANDNFGMSNIDPTALVRDGNGNFIGSGDDEIPCDFPQVCGNACPDIPAFGVLSCGLGGTFTIQVADFGFCTANGGGGYLLFVVVFDKDGVLLPATKIKLGGGAKRKTPKWFDPNKLHVQGPIFDDEELPD